MPIPVREPVSGEGSVTDEVDTAYIPFVPLETKRLPLENDEVVASPFQESVRDVVKSPPPPNGKLVVIDTALLAGVNPNSEEDAT